MSVVRFLMARVNSRSDTAEFIRTLLVIASRRKKGETKKDELSRSSGIIRRNVVHYISECPKAAHWIAWSRSLSRRVGDTPMRTVILTSCVSSRNEDHLLAVYHDEVQYRLSTSFSSMTRIPSPAASPGEKTMFEYIEFIISLASACELC